MSCPGAG